MSELMVDSASGKVLKLNVTVLCVMFALYTVTVKSHSPCKKGPISLIPGFSSPLVETLYLGHVSI